MAPTPCGVVHDAMASEHLDFDRCGFASCLAEYVARSSVVRARTSAFVVITVSNVTGRGTASARREAAGGSVLKCPVVGVACLTRVVTPHRRLAWVA